MSQIQRVPSTTTEDKGRRKVIEPVTASYVVDGQERDVHVPDGFEYKIGVSVRFGLVGLIDIFAPTYALEDVSCYHDWLYKNRDKHLFTRREADAVMMADDRDPYVIRLLAWLIVRAVGWTVW